MLTSKDVIAFLKLVRNSVIKWQEDLVNIDGTLQWQSNYRLCF